MYNVAATAESTSVRQYYLRRRLASEGIVTLGVTLSRCVCIGRISLVGEGNALYPVLSIVLWSVERLASAVAKYRNYVSSTQ